MSGGPRAGRWPSQIMTVTSAAAHSPSWLHRVSYWSNAQLCNHSLHHVVLVLCPVADWRVGLCVCRNSICKVRTATASAGGTATSTCAPGETLLSGGCASSAILTGGTVATRLSKTWRYEDIIGWTCTRCVAGSGRAPQPKGRVLQCRLSSLLLGMPTQLQFCKWVYLSRVLPAITRQKVLPPYLHLLRLAALDSDSNLQLESSCLVSARLGHARPSS